MSDEESFQAALDAAPDDQVTRAVFGDWLEDRGDPRGPGYRALARLGRVPLTRGPYRFMWSSALGRRVSADRHVLPSDWYSHIAIGRIPAGDGGHALAPNPTLQQQDTDGRREVEDKVARAFALLPPERQAQLLTAPFELCHESA